MDARTYNHSVSVVLQSKYKIDHGAVLVHISQNPQTALNVLFITCMTQMYATDKEVSVKTL